MTVPPDISVIIPVRNGAATLADQLEALVAAEKPTGGFEVIVADNGSTDDTSAIAASYAGALPIAIIDAGAVAGINYARNKGVQASRGPHILLCDSDDVVDSQWLVQMRSGFTHGADLVAGRLDYLQLNPRAVWQWRGSAGASVSTMLDFLPFGHGACLGFTRSIFDKIGGFDEAFRGGGDDVDFCWRAQLAGARLQDVPAAVVHYRLRQSLGALAKQEADYGAAEAWLYRKFRKQGLRRRRPVQFGRDLWWLLSRLPFAWPGDRRGAWIRRASRLHGRLRGAVQARTWWW